MTVVYLSLGRGRKKVERKEGMSGGRDENGGILSTVISAPIRTFIAKVTHTYG